jgi:hypothetical protein
VLVVGADHGETELTLFLDLSAWFADGQGSLVDPRTATDGGANRVWWRTISSARSTSSRTGTMMAGGMTLKAAAAADSAP